MVRQDDVTVRGECRRVGTKLPEICRLAAERRSVCRRASRGRDVSSSASRSAFSLSLARTPCPSLRWASPRPAPRGTGSPFSDAFARAINQPRERTRTGRAIDSPCVGSAAAAAGCRCKNERRVRRDDVATSRSRCREPSIRRRRRRRRWKTDAAENVSLAELGGGEY